LERSTDAARAIDDASYGGGESEITLERRVGPEISGDSSGDERVGSVDESAHHEHQQNVVTHRVIPNRRGECAIEVERRDGEGEIGKGNNGSASKLIAGPPRDDASNDTTDIAEGR